jgi:hypothetical protein
LSGRSVSYGTGSLHPSQSFKGKYEYCGHGFIVGNKRNDWQDVDYVLRFFNRKKGIAQGRYKEYVSEGIERRVKGLKEMSGFSGIVSLF